MIRILALLYKVLSIDCSVLSRNWTVTRRREVAAPVPPVESQPRFPEYGVDFFY